MKVKLKKVRDNAVIPEFKTDGAAGLDLTVSKVDMDYDHDVNAIVMYPGQIVKFGTGIAVSIPKGYFIDIRPRSGMAINKGLTVINSPGTIDSDYRGEIIVGIINHSKELREVKIGDRIAQMVIMKYEKPEFDIVDELDETDRGDGKLGSTGTN